MEVDRESVNINVTPYANHPHYFPAQRKLNFSPSPSDDDDIPPQTEIMSPVKHSPPCRPFRTLNLSELPTTPGTIYSNSLRKNNLLANVLSNRLSAPNLNPFTPESIARSRKRCRSEQSHHDLADDSMGCNVNTLNNNVIKSSPVSADDEDERPAKRLSIIESNTGLSRYLTEFEEKYLLGTGEFGCVYLCTNRMDGCDYAIKKSNRPLVPGTANEKRALNEVFAHAVLGKHNNVVRYFSAWSENKHMLIQNEYCNGGSLQDAIESNRASGTSFPEPEIRRILLHLSEGLRYIHSHKLVHMDIKPGNIFISRESRVRPLNYQADDSFEEEEETVVYKFGDFGHVTSLTIPQRGVEEGDSRYLAMEVFHDDYSNLTKADIFALGLTVYEAAGGKPLQKNGPEWHEMREGKVPELSTISKDLNELIKQMTHRDPHKRPTALEILKHTAVLTPEKKSKEQLERELHAVKTRFQLLEKKLKSLSNAYKNEMLVRDMSTGVRTRSNTRVVGKSTLRSHSTTEFGW